MDREKCRHCAKKGADGPRGTSNEHAIKDVQLMIAGAKRALMPRSVLTTLEQHLSVLKIKKCFARPIGTRYDSAVAKIKRLKVTVRNAEDDISKAHKAMMEASARHVECTDVLHEAQKELDIVGERRSSARFRRSERRNKLVSTR